MELKFELATEPAVKATIADGACCSIAHIATHSQNLFGIVALVIIGINPNHIPNVIYKSKWFSTLLCCGWAGPPLHCSTFVLVHVGVDITDLGVWASCVVRYWLRLQMHPTSISYVNEVF